MEADPTLGLFDLFIIHLDADVAHKAYTDCGASAVNAAMGLPALPCDLPCPPSVDTVKPLSDAMLAWLGISQPGQKTIFCIPSKASEAWLAAAILPDGHPLLNNLECNLRLEQDLSLLPKPLRVKKSKREYQVHALTISSQWAKVCNLCPQADVFQQALTQGHGV
ncbi:MAG: hypothetical protein NTV43_13585 [Methylococcales bacterium]|nr:hypothetical protein [Methylococcales bacterium]